VKSLRRMIRFVKPYQARAIMAMALLLGVVVSDLSIPRLTQRVIDEGVARQDLALVVTTSLLMLGAAMVSALFSIGNTLLSVRVTQGVAADIRSAIVRQVQTFSFGNLDRVQTGQLLVRATSDVNMVQMMVLMSLRMLTRAPLWMLGSMTMLILTSPRLSLLMLALLPVIFGIVWFFLTRGRALFLTVQTKLDRLNQVLQENLAGVRVVKAFERGVYENARFRQANEELTAQSIKVAQLVAMVLPTMLSFVNLTIVGVLWFGGGLTIRGDFTVGEIVASINYMTFSLFPMMMMAGLIVPLSAADASAGRILEVLDSVADVQNRPSARPLQSIEGRVAFEDVGFSYNHACSERVLEGVNLTAEPGQRVAILGATGSGKSSLIHLIPRFYDVEQGRVTLDGVDVRDIPLDTLRPHVGVALQDPVLFAGSIRDNIRYGRPEATEEEVVAAARAAQAHGFVLELPDGYDTLVGQRGVNLSGGQKQRIAIARALLVRPKVLILDDSTSAVDVETEARIEVALEHLAAECTTFVVAQRISTVLSADKIVVLDQGRVAAQGTHAELMESSPIYREIYESQLGDGRPVSAGMDRGHPARPQPLALTHCDTAETDG